MYTFILDGLDDIWNKANDILDSMPDELITQHGPKLSAAFRIHALTMISEIQKRVPGELSDRPVAMLRETLTRIENGDLREALRDLALGIIAIAPPDDRSMAPQFEDLFNRSDDKSVALLQSVDRNGVGIMPFTLRLMFQSTGVTPENFYRKNLDRVFPNPETVTVVTRTFDA